jgi:hypothetical protein
MQEEGFMSLGRFMVRRDDEDNYSPLDSVLSLTLRPLPRSDELVKLIFSVEREKRSQRQPFHISLRTLRKRPKTPNTLKLGL